MRRRRLLQGAFSAVAWPNLSAAQAVPPPAAAPSPAFAPSDTVLIKGAAHQSSLTASADLSPSLRRALAAAQDFSDGLGGRTLLVSLDGRLVHETYAPGATAATRLKTYSMAKSALGLTYGLAVAQGVVRLEDSLGGHVEELRSDPRGAITLRQLLQMRSGLKLESLARSGPKVMELVVGRKVTRTALETPLVAAPGETFEYNNVNTMLAGLALDRALGRA